MRSSYALVWFGDEPTVIQANLGRVAFGSRFGAVAGGLVDINE